MCIVLLLSHCPGACMHRAKEIFHLVILLCPHLHTRAWQRGQSLHILVRGDDYLCLERVKKQDPSQLNILGNLKAKESSVWSKTPSPSTQKPVLSINIYTSGRGSSALGNGWPFGLFGITVVALGKHTYLCVHAIFLSSVSWAKRKLSARVNYF